MLQLVSAAELHFYQANDLRNVDIGQHREIEADHKAQGLFDDSAIVHLMMSQAVLNNNRTTIEHINPHSPTLI